MIKTNRLQTSIASLEQNGAKHHTIEHSAFRLHANQLHDVIKLLLLAHRQSLSCECVHSHKAPATITSRERCVAKSTQVTRYCAMSFDKTGKSGEELCELSGAPKSSQKLSFSLQITGGDAKQAFRCSLRAGRARIVEKLLLFVTFSHDLNSHQKKGAQPSPPDPLSQRGALTKRTLGQSPDRESQHE